MNEREIKKRKRFENSQILRFFCRCVFYILFSFCLSLSQFRIHFILVFFARHRFVYAQQGFQLWLNRRAYQSQKPPRKREIDRKKYKRKNHKIILNKTKQTGAKRVFYLWFCFYFFPYFFRFFIFSCFLLSFCLSFILYSVLQ